MLQANTILRLARSSKKKLSNLQNANSQVRDLVSMTFFLLGIMLTLPFFLGTVPWFQSTPDRISIETDKSKLPHGLQSHIEPTLD